GGERLQVAPDWRGSGAPAGTRPPGSRVEPGPGEASARGPRARQPPRGDERVTELYEGRRSDRGAGPPATVLAWVVVALCAVFGGVGVATLGTSAGSGAAAPVPSGSRVRSQAPHMIELTFNPRSARGPRIAKVGFHF